MSCKNLLLTRDEDMIGICKVEGSQPPVRWCKLENPLPPCEYYEGDENKCPRFCETLDSQIDRLAKFIMEKIEGEPSQNEGAIDTAIRLLDKWRKYEKIFGWCKEQQGMSTEIHYNLYMKEWIVKLFRPDVNAENVRFSEAHNVNLLSALEDAYNPYCNIYLFREVAGEEVEVD